MEKVPSRKQEVPEGGPSALTKTLLSAVAAIGMLSTPDHKQLTSAEIGTLENWQDGASKLKRAAQTGSKEVSAVFGQFQNGVGAWMQPIIGDETSVPLGREKYTLELESASAAADGKRPTFICHIHTHPNDMVANKMGRSRKNTLSAYPPSFTDTTYAEQEDDYFKHSPLLKNVPIRHAVFAGQGVFYYGPLSNFWHGDIYKIAPDEETERRNLAKKHQEFRDAVKAKFTKFTLPELFELYRATDNGKKDRGSLVDVVRSHGNDEQEAARTLRQVLVSVAVVGNQKDFAAQFVTEEERKGDKSKELEALEERHEQYAVDVYSRFVSSTLDGTPPTKELLAELTKAYALKGALIRYVPYEDLHKEPVCAGNRYGRDKK